MRGVTTREESDDSKTWRPSSGKDTAVMNCDKKICGRSSFDWRWSRIRGLGGGNMACWWSRADCPKRCHFGILIISNWCYLRNNCCEKDTLTLFSFPWKQEIDLPHERHPACTRRKRDIPIMRDAELKAEKVVSTNLVTSLIYYPIPNPFVLSIIHKFIVSV